MLAPYTSSGITTSEVGGAVEVFGEIIFSGEPSQGIRRESGLMLLKVLNGAIKSEPTATVESILEGMSPEQRGMFGDIIDRSGIVDTAPTNRERSEAQNIVEVLDKLN